ncbi:hypothetical protein [Pedobacter nyackensis]|uniref:Uncharacterized protein n=1 Tax=Pedobacter nyackensis TaxID=475255 RepID=A0A1W1ZXY1_9SPHI|nr:hypothetical protein [Pedobacter nyackensis]SMC52908.1 hypothetical protein SAMN04488101_101115 [Pedobacter nyackensis]
MLKIILSFVAAFGFIVGIVILCGWLFDNFDGKILAGWWGCLLYTYLTERTKSARKEVSNG